MLRVPALRLTRRQLIAWIGAVTAAIGRDGPNTGDVHAQESLPEITPGIYFAETGHNLRDPFLAVWTALGGEPTVGVPLSEERYDESIGVAQNFTRITLVYDPGLDAPWDIQGQLLPPSFVQQLAPANARKKVSTCQADAFFCQHFPETGHTISGGIASFWTLNGGAPILGMPLSEPFTERGKSFATQVFEKAVLEDHGADDVRVRETGAELAESAGLTGTAAFLPAPPTAGETLLVTAEDGLRLREGPSAQSQIETVLADNAEFISPRGNHGEWIPGYADGFSGWVSSEFLTVAPPLARISTADWNPEVWQGASLGESNVRRLPDTKSEIVRVLDFREALEVSRWVQGEEVYQGADLWARIDDDQFVYARNVGRTGPVAAPPLPGDAPATGAWIDANLTQQLLVAYVDRDPVHVAVMTSGMAGWETPPGMYWILVRVANETMDSGAIGAEHFYKLENVLYTQYFSDEGHAIHYAWWRTPETIGRPGSHGCLNLLLDDARLFWEWADVGTPVFVHH